MSNEEQIINKLGDNHVMPCQLDKHVDFVHAIYTYNGWIYCLNEGEDFEFNSLPEEQQKFIVKEILEGSYKYNEYAI